MSREDIGVISNTVIILVIVIATAILLGMGKIDATSGTPIFGAALGVGGLASQSKKTFLPPPENHNEEEHK